MNYVNLFLAPEGGNGWMGTLGLLFPFIIVFGIVYFFMIRPEKRRRQEIYNMQSEIVKGDKVISIGGIYGIVDQVTDTTITIVVADGTRFKMEKGAIKGRQPEDTTK